MAPSAICLRTCSRVNNKAFGLDEVLRIIATVLSVAHMTASHMRANENEIYETERSDMNYAYMRFHIKDIRWNDHELSCIWMYIINVLCNPIIAVFQMSVFIFILGPGSYNTIDIINLYMIIGCLSRHVALSFPGTCVTQPAYYAARTDLNLLADLVVLIGLIWTFWYLVLNKVRDAVSKT
ncbi:uncharacterized protein PpBr36_09419 [Pyricularia pennisetigena]|uniref:uncharacterized protein n=1 Tax=Pyricularia pennisetigena TaxID=1578925 RepID=UPI00114E5248|nr:uncharacterized protein PpBr36_09419 [Pyricularia pennisetigena]TLS21958.1 hypothetical protein PpBr36_09419 [Pyricularia pennisetigena]